MHGVGHEERPVGPGGEAVAQGEVAGIEAAHEADRHERRGQGVMGAHHLDGLGGRGHQRLLAQDGQARFEAGEGERGVEGVRGGDDDGVDGARGDHLLAVAEDPRAAEGGGQRLGAGDVRVGDGGQAGAAHAPGEVVGMVGAHDPGADDADGELLAHDSSLNTGERATSGCAQRRKRLRASAQEVDHSPSATSTRQAGFPHASVGSVRFTGA